MTYIFSEKTGARHRRNAYFPDHPFAKIDIIIKLKLRYIHHHIISALGTAVAPAAAVNTAKIQLGTLGPHFDRGGGGPTYKIMSSSLVGGRLEMFMHGQMQSATFVVGATTSDPGYDDVRQWISGCNVLVPEGCRIWNRSDGAEHYLGPGRSKGLAYPGLWVQFLNVPADSPLAGHRVQIVETTSHKGGWESIIPIGTPGYTPGQEDTFYDEVVAPFGYALPQNYKVWKAALDSIVVADSGLIAAHLAMGYTLNEVAIAWSADAVALPDGLDGKSNSIFTSGPKLDDVPVDPYTAWWPEGLILLPAGSWTPGQCLGLTVNFIDYYPMCLQDEMIAQAGVAASIMGAI